VLNVAIDRPGAFTRTELIEATGLSAPTVGIVTMSLIETGVLTDLGTAPSRGGRRPTLMEFNARYAFVAGIDLGPTRTRLALADLRGQQLAMEIVPTPSGVGPEELIADLAVALRALMTRLEIPEDRLLAVAAGVPGPVDLATGTVLYAPNLKGWTNVPVLRLLQREFHTTVLIENDVNLALLGEHWRGAARGHDTCAFIFVGTGIGSAILIDGTLHHGHHYMAGEIGFMTMAPEHAGQDFGTRGCLETLAGLDALRGRWPRAAQEPPSRWFAALLEQAQQGDADARAAIDETARLIGMATANVATVVDPSIIVLGGSMFAEPGPLVDAVRLVVRQIARTPFDVAVSALGKEAPLAGCLLVGRMEAQRRVRQRLKKSLNQRSMR
jgi:predicted NBD/HSP70 family sugar kinase